MSPALLHKAMDYPDLPKFDSSEHTIALLKGAGTECESMSTNPLEGRVESRDYVLKFIQKLQGEEFQETSACEVWANETVLFFTAHRYHIFFRFLDYYNVHKLLKDMKMKKTPVRSVVRISGNEEYIFPEFERKLFPEAKVQSLEEFEDIKTCFKTVVLVPKSYASPMFQCKNSLSLKNRCMGCNGSGLNGTDINLFKNRVLNACASNGQLPKMNGSLIVLVSRHPYLRNGEDNLRYFERVLENEKKLVDALESSFPKTKVEVIQLEKLSVCEQIAYAHNADVFLGVHGSGLVHLWWTQDDAVIYEMEPMFEVGNPTFRMLSKLTGRTYHSEHVLGTRNLLSANVKNVISNLKTFSRLH